MDKNQWKWFYWRWEFMRRSDEYRAAYAKRSGKGGGVDFGFNFYMDPDKTLDEIVVDEFGKDTPLARAYLFNMHEMGRVIWILPASVEKYPPKNRGVIDLRIDFNKVNSKDADGTGLQP